MQEDIGTVFNEQNSAIIRELRRREAEVPNELYAPWNEAEQFTLAERKLAAAAMLHRAGAFPKSGDAALEIGYGKLGWLADLISWGIGVTDLHGIELDGERAAAAQRLIPGADLRVGDASTLPWEDGKFRLAVVSTVFSSIASDELRRRIAGEIGRVLHRNGALVWYDLAVDNPRNPNVKGISRKQIAALFPEMSAEIRSVTLAPPLARALVKRAPAIATCLRSVPLLRTHLLAVLKPR